jgi:predicted TIM-barrel fold metal-dependent hydrolase
MINGHTQGAFLDDKRFWGIFECAEALGVPIYLHPSKPHPAVMGAYFAGYEELALAAWGFGIETGAHFLRLVFAGVFDAFPNLTFILGHLGEGLPFMLHRINDQTHLAAAPRPEEDFGAISDGKSGRHLQRKFFRRCLPMHRNGARRGQRIVFELRRSQWSEGRGPRGMRTSKARTGLRARLACHRRWLAYGA